MTIIRNVATAAALAACVLSAATVSAADRTDRVPVTVNVSHADLDLAKAGDRVRLAQRIARAARRACGIGSMRGAAMTDADRCYHEMLADGDGQLAAIERRGAVQVAAR
ncbi:UrcA family protein [Sphingomonas mollis]|uniref:UrcA family protein n=1 Tax=Sphingomonas mollis TaxID=2795726 RepID=A0ABS0XLP9_9SPHN|nr:UrcA family protein [Sphingomonas sp. BT553]MBJ6120947.1 UrcA family protein [Sphingomonas sp. BT553]